MTVHQSLGLVSLLVPDYDEALAFFVGRLGFELIEDAPRPGAPPKRWVVVRPPGTSGAGLLLTRAASAAQQALVGQQGAGKVFLFLYTDDLLRDYAAWQAQGVVFVEPPVRKPHGMVAIFQDPWGNGWDVIEPAGGP